MRGAIGFGLALVLVLSATAAQAQQLAGTYKLVSGKRGDMEIPKDRLDGIVRIMPGTMTVYDKDNNEVYVIRYSLEQDDKPMRIAMTVTKSTRSESVGSKARGLIKVEGNRATMIYDYKGDDYPGDFEPKGDTQHLFIMERTDEK
jgi:uncharacterized protein (TIGR03067 family)